MIFVVVVMFVIVVTFSVASKFDTCVSCDIVVDVTSIVHGSLIYCDQNTDLWLLGDSLCLLWLFGIWALRLLGIFRLLGLFWVLAYFAYRNSSVIGSLRLSGLFSYRGLSVIGLLDDRDSSVIGAL